MLGKSIFDAVAPRRTLVALGLSAIVGLAMSSAARAAITCPSQITKCGCSIVSPGRYLVTASLSQLGPGACIDIQAQNTVLEFASSLGRQIKVTGGNQGIGVWIESSASYSVVLGMVGAQPPPPVVPGGEAKITQFQYAIEDDADNTVIGYFDKLNSNSSGVYLNGVSNVTAGNFCADGNRVAGILAVNTKNSRIYDFTAEKNMQDGVLLAGSSNNALYNLSSVYNFVDGIVLQDSDNNSVSPASVSSNAVTGIRIGCGATSTPITCESTSDSNHIVGTAVEGIFTGDVSNCDGRAATRQSVGIRIETNNSLNTIANNRTSANSKFDLEDDNLDCDGNLWVNNTFTGKITPPCTGNP